MSRTEHKLTVIVQAARRVLPLGSFSIGAQGAITYLTYFLATVALELKAALPCNVRDRLGLVQSRFFS